MPVSRAICWVDVIWVACFLEGSGIERWDSRGSEGADWFVVGRGGGPREKWGEVGKASKLPPSSERETWILVSLVSRERVARRRGQRSEEPMMVAQDQAVLYTLFGRRIGPFRSHRMLRN